MFAVDDDLEASPKHEALDGLPATRRARAFEAWLRLGAACRKRGNGGLVTLALVDKILHAWKPMERAQTLVDLVEARGGRARGLLVAEGDAWRFHEWQSWQPDEEESAVERDKRAESAERSRRYRASKKAKSVTPIVTPNVTNITRDDVTKSRDAERDEITPRALRAPATRVRVPDPVPIPSLPHGDLRGGGSLDQVREPDAPPPLAPAAALTRDAEIIRRTAQAAFEGAGVPPPRAVRDLDGKPWVALVDPVRDIAARDGATVADVATALLAGFLASERAKARGYPIGFLVANPAEYLTTRTEPAADLQRLLDGIPKGSTEPIPEDDGDPFGLREPLPKKPTTRTT